MAPSLHLHPPLYGYGLSQTCSIFSVVRFSGINCSSSPIWICIGDIGRPIMSIPKCQTVIFCVILEIEEFRDGVRM